MNKIIITQYNGRIMTAEADEKRILDISFEESGRVRIDDIYTGRVESIADNIKAAFIEVADGVKCFYQMKPDEKLKIGQELPVQIRREAVKTKDAECDIRLSIPGKYVVVTEGIYSLGISSKIPDGPRRFELQQLFDVEFSYDDEFSFIIRTNALEAENEVILEEARTHMEMLRALRESASHSVPFKKLYSGSSVYSDKLRDHRGEICAVTDVKEIYEDILSSFPEIPAEFYQDEMLSLVKLYRIESAIEDALARKVWLKSGGYLVIDETEALTVIDVNTGKNDTKGKMEEVFFKTNIEAAREAAAQLRLRNISGMIIIDFIDMKSKGHLDELVSVLKKELFNDPVKASFVDVTKLNLVEVTRKKMLRSLREQLA